MSRRSVGALILFLSLRGMVGIVSPGQVAGAGAEPLPNVLIFMTDDQRGQGTLGVMPSVRRWFVRGGRRFPRAIATTPVCCPSRASVLTGRYAHNHGVRSNQAGSKLDHATTMQRHLQRAGYLTAYAGKFLNHWPLDRDPPHFDRWVLLRHGYADPHANVDGQNARLRGYSTDLLSRFARDLVADFEETDSRPWLLIVAPVAPHSPATPEPAFRRASVPPWKPSPAVRERDLSDKPPHLRSSDVTIKEVRRFRQRQLRTLLSVDDLVKQLFGVLQDLREVSRTLAVYTSDNGLLWGEHGLRRKAKPYKPSISVPLLMRWPTGLPSATTDRRLAANIDIFPTVLDAAGLDSSLSPPLDGRSLLGDDRSVILAEKLAGRHRWAALSTKRYRYIEWYRRGRSRPFFREFYRLRGDPWELRNTFADGKRANDPPKRRLHRRLARLRRCDGTTGTDACP